MSVFIVVTFMIGVICSSIEARDILHRIGDVDLPEFDYDLKGKDWRGVCQAGRMQSPIEINTESCTTLHDKYAIEFINEDLATLNVSIATHSVAIEAIPVERGLQFGMTSDSLRGLYKFESAHFHWPAEHLIDGKRYPLEMHIVHYRNRYANLSQALRDPDGVAVIAVLFDLGEGDPLIQNMMDRLKNRTHRKLKARVSDLLPSSTMEFYKYEGSLTTPPCSESVEWTVMKKVRSVNQKQLKWFKNLVLESGEVLRETYRSIQRLNNRNIIYVSLRSEEPEKFTESRPSYGSKPQGSYSSSGSYAHQQRPISTSVGQRPRPSNNNPDWSWPRTDDDRFFQN